MLEKIYAFRAVEQMNKAVACVGTTLYQKTLFME